MDLVLEGRGGAPGPRSRVAPVPGSGRSWPAAGLHVCVSQGLALGPDGAATARPPRLGLSPRNLKNKVTAGLANEPSFIKEPLRVPA